MEKDYKDNITRIEDFFKKLKGVKEETPEIIEKTPNNDSYRKMYGKADDTVLEAKKAAVGHDPERLAKLSKIASSDKFASLPADQAMKVQNELRMMQRNMPKGKDVMPFLSKIRNSAKLIPILGPMIGLGAALGTGDAGAAVPVPGFESEALSEGEAELLEQARLEDEEKKKRVWNIFKDTPKREY